MLFSNTVAFFVMLMGATRSFDWGAVGVMAAAVLLMGWDLLH